MCKKTIEKAANAVDGVSNAIWNVDEKKIDIALENPKTDVMAIHNAIAVAVYDTEKIAGSEDAYKGLPGSCQYDHAMQVKQ